MSGNSYDRDAIRPGLERAYGRSRSDHERNGIQGCRKGPLAGSGGHHRRDAIDPIVHAGGTQHQQKIAGTIARDVRRERNIIYQDEDLTVGRKPCSPESEKAAHFSGAVIDGDRPSISGDHLQVDPVPGLVIDITDGTAAAVIGLDQLPVLVVGVSDGHRRAPGRRRSEYGGG